MTGGCWIPHIRRRLRAEPHGTGAGHPASCGHAAAKRRGAETTLGGCEQGRGSARCMGTAPRSGGAAWDRTGAGCSAPIPAAPRHRVGSAGCPRPSGVPLSCPWAPLGGSSRPPTPLPLPRQEVPGCSEPLWAGRKSPRGLFDSPSSLAATYAAQKTQPCPVLGPEHAVPTRPPARCRYLGAPGWHGGGVIGVWATHLGMGWSRILLTVAHTWGRVPIPGLSGCGEGWGRPHALNQNSSLPQFPHLHPKCGAAGSWSQP